MFHIHTTRGGCFYVATRANPGKPPIYVFVKRTNFRGWDLEKYYENPGHVLTHEPPLLENTWPLLYF